MMSGAGLGGNSQSHATNGLFSGNVNWALIREHYGMLMQLALAIQSGILAPSAVLARINSFSSRNRFALALQELGSLFAASFS